MQHLGFKPLFQNQGTGKELRLTAAYGNVISEKIIVSIILILALSF
jgi:hypothetical protein